MDSGFQVLVRISYFSASDKEELLFTKLNVSLGLFAWVLPCTVIFADVATCWWDVLIVFFGSNASKLSCFLLVTTDLPSRFVS